MLDKLSTLHFPNPRRTPPYHRSLSLTRFQCWVETEWKCMHLSNIHETTRSCSRTINISSITEFVISHLDFFYCFFIVFSTGLVQLSSTQTFCIFLVVFRWYLNVPLWELDKIMTTVLWLKGQMDSVPSISSHLTWKVSRGSGCSCSKETLCGGACSARWTVWAPWRSVWVESCYASTVSERTKESYNSHSRMWRIIQLEKQRYRQGPHGLFHDCLFTFQGYLPNYQIRYLTQILYLYQK